MEKDKTVKTCNSSWIQWEEAAAHSLRTTVLFYDMEIFTKLCIRFWVILHRPGLEF